MWLAAAYVCLPQTPQAQSQEAKPKAAPAKAKVASPAKAASSAKAPEPTPVAPAQIATYPLESLKVEGNRLIPTARIIAASGLKVGLNVDKSDFDGARDRLVATGAFENVGYEYKPGASGSGYDAVLQVIEVAQMFAYRFEDLPASDDVLRAALKKQQTIFDERIPASAAVLDRFAKIIQQAAGGNVEVVAKLTPDPPDTVIVFRPPGSLNNVAEVRFVGNEVLPATVLTRALSAVAVGVPYTERNFRQILEVSVRALYDARGRIRVEFPHVTTERAPKVEGLIVTTTINEGPVYKLGSVRLAGVLASQTAEMEKAANWKKGDIANFDDVQAGVERVRVKYRQTGYLDVKARVDRDVHDAEQEVNLTVTVEPGAQYKMGKLSINGLDIISEPVIRKMWQLAEGRPFQPDYPESFLARVNEEGLFDNLGKTRAEPNVNTTTHVVDVALFFAGGRPQDKEGKDRRRLP
jgi:outer membrane protein insertion porin family